MKATWRKVYHSNGRRTITSSAGILDDLRFIQPRPPSDCVIRFMSTEYLQALRERVSEYHRELQFKSRD